MTRSLLSCGARLSVGLCLSVAVACGAEHANELEAHAQHASGSAPGAHGSAASSADFPPPAPGYTRIVAPVIESIPPGADVMRCQYVQAPLDRDVDILDLQGHQSAGGHHAVAYSTIAVVPVGTSRTCEDDDNLNQGAFLGALGGEGGGGADLPEGVAFRLPKGSAIMLNTHFLNTSDDTIDGHTVVDIKFSEPDGKRLYASLLTSGTQNFRIPARGTAEAVSECKLPRPMKILMFANHMHDQGASVISEIMRADGRVELAHEDPKWTYEMQFRGVFTKWSLDAPLMLEAGDVIRTRCRWSNTLDSELVFPREMCFGLAFFITERASAPLCMDGMWIER